MRSRSFCPVGRGIVVVALGAFSPVAVGAVPHPTLETVTNGPIFFERYSAAEGGSDIYRVNPDGTGLTNLTRDLPSASAPFVTPDGTRVYFTLDSDPLHPDRDDRFAVYSMRADGEGKQRVELPAGANWPSVAGAQLAYQRCDIRTFACVPWVSDLLGRDARQVLPTTVAAFVPVLAPDGQKVLVRIREGSPSVFPQVHRHWVVPLDGTAPNEIGGQLLKQGETWGANLSWSYDGRVVLGATSDAPYLVATDGEAIERLPWAGGRIRSLAIAPDGREVVVQSVSHYDGDAEIGELRAVRLDGQHDRVLVRGTQENGNRISWSVTTPPLPPPPPPPDGVVVGIQQALSGDSFTVTVRTRRADAVIAQGFAIRSTASPAAVGAAPPTRLALRASGRRVVHSTAGRSTTVRVTLRARTLTDRALLRELLRAGGARLGVRVTFLTKKGGDRLRQRTVAVSPPAR